MAQRKLRGMEFARAVLLVALDATLHGYTTAATKCLKDESLDAYPVNVYFCNSSSAPVCCQTSSSFECCPTQSTKTTNEQLAVWGTVFGVALLVTVVWTCYRKDNYICEGANLYRRFTTMRRNKTAADDTIAIQKTVSNQSTPSHDANTLRMTMVADDREASSLTSSGVLPTIAMPTPNNNAPRESATGSDIDACTASQAPDQKQTA